MKGLRFYGLLDFYPRREEIKKSFDKLILDDKILFKKEVYSLCFEKEYVKDLIWEYLNGWEEAISNLTKEYLLKKNKMKQRNNYENNDTNEARQLE